MRHEECPLCDLAVMIQARAEKLARNPSSDK
jgi:hypothetical protein